VVELLSASVEAVGARLGWLNFLNTRENDIGTVWCQKAFTREAYQATRADGAGKVRVRW
jgi:hypothetical protein